MALLFLLAYFLSYNKAKVVFSTLKNYCLMQMTNAVFLEIKSEKVLLQRHKNPTKGKHLA